MPQVVLSLSGGIVVWVISGLLFIVALFIAINVFILPFFKAKQTKQVNDIQAKDPVVIPNRADAQIDQLRQQLDALIIDIDKFLSKSQPSPGIIPAGTGEVLSYRHQQSNSQYGHNTGKLFNIKFSKLRQKIDFLKTDIDQFVSKSQPSAGNTQAGHSEPLSHGNAQSDFPYNRNTANLFDIQFSNRLENVLYFLRRRGIVSEREGEVINRIAQPDHLNIDRILSLLKEYRSRLK